MKTIIFFILLVILLFTAEAILSLETTIHPEQDNDNLIHEFIVLVLCMGGLLVTGKSIFRKYSR
ncbi:hypothetical protein [Pontibacter arcticus]|uniref:Uncharacterized protein n=1 Tax=Pontibacter arcticus TaxID=2080288 RepID=A0A364RHI8_9BACT|nr:hypothetical protein [Pontibacter arcticus]RAU83769.1 hypothetical protein DP923_01495 [Pontibacter arcticus]